MTSEFSTDRASNFLLSRTAGIPYIPINSIDADHNVDEPYPCRRCGRFEIASASAYPVPSKVEDGKHDFIVYLPPMYDEQPDRRFPVLYMQDGQNLFDPETCFINGNYWRMGETADHLIGTGEIEPLIIVGIYNAGEHRLDEYTPVEDKRLGGGEAEAYGQMIAEELKPFVDPHLPHAAGPRACGLGGSSLGGLVTLYLGLRYTWLFSKLAVMSPSVWWRNRAILKTVAKIQRKPELKIWLDIGTRESRSALPDARELHDAAGEEGLVRRA